jgi:hypothetical protein
MTSRIHYTCDIVVDEVEYAKSCEGGLDGNAHYEKSLCNRTASSIGEAQLGIFVGNNMYHVCHDHLQLPLIELYRMLHLLTR